MGKELMFGFVDFCTNPVAGNYADSVGETFIGERPFCINNCVYCYATEIKQKHPEWDKYKGPYRLEPSALKEYPDGSMVFLQDMGDIGDPLIPFSVTDSIYRYITDHPKITYLTLTKNPAYYLSKLDIMADLKNIIYGVTIETNNFIPGRISKAPSPMSRFIYMGRLRRQLPEARILVSVEPIMEFNLDSLATHIIGLHPEIGQSKEEPHVAVGYDNHGHHLPEPSLSKTYQLIERLEARGIIVYRKTLREART